MAWFPDVITLFQRAIAFVVVIVSVAFFFFAYFVSPILVLFVLCDARDVFRSISHRSHRYVASLFFLGCVAWLVYWYLKLTPVCGGRKKLDSLIRYKMDVTDVMSGGSVDEQEASCIQPGV